MSAAASKPPFDWVALVLHVLALAVWPLTVGYSVWRLLGDRYPVRSHK